MGGDELALVDWLRQQQRQRAGVRLGVGDDMAIVTAHRAGAHGLDADGQPIDSSFLISSDMLLDGVHFDTATQPFAAIGQKAIACGLSDCAAMAVEPVAATVSLALPHAARLADVQELFHGMFAMADEFGLAIVGGDTTRWGSAEGRLAIDVAVTASAYPNIEPVTRRGARPGDRLYVTGPLGGSLLGRHLTFVPRVREARALAATLGARLHALMDISDGLSLDLSRMIRASNVGASLHESDLAEAISADAVRAASDSGRTPLDHALSDGEDFELLLAVEGDVVDPPATLLAVGYVTERVLTLTRRTGEVEPLEPKGFVH